MLSAMASMDGRMALDKLFHPDTVAVLGASDTAGKIGNIITKHLIEGGLKVYPVNPNEEEVLGVRALKSILDSPEHVEVAILAISAKNVVDGVRDCVRARVDYVIPVAGGFSEIGEAGKEIQDQMAAEAKGSATRILGPNTMGVMVPGGIDTFFIPKEKSPRPRLGSISLISQSGSVLIGVYEKAEVEGVGIRACVGIGNRADLGEDELLRYFGEEEGTKCIAMYLEAFQNGTSFHELAKIVSAIKPIVVAKVGSTPRGARAAMSHTGALAESSNTLVSGVLRQAGVLRVNDERELLDAAKALAALKPMMGDRVAVVGSAGGFGVIATDYVTSTSIGFGLQMAELSEESRDRIRGIGPYFGSADNPIDLTGAVTDKMYDDVLDIVDKDPGVDGIVLFLQFEPPAMTPALADIVEKWARQGTKPMTVCCVGGSFPLPVMKRLDAKGIPTYGTIKRSVFALSCVRERGRFLQRISKQGISPLKA